MAINEILSPLIKISDAALNKIFKEEDFNFFKKLNFKKFKINSQQISSALLNVTSELFIKKQFS